MNTHEHESNQLLRSEISRVNDFLNDIQQVVVEQKKFASNEQVQIETNLNKLCDNIDNDYQLSNQKTMSINNQVNDDTTIYLDSFKVRSIISQIFQHITSYYHSEETISIKISAKLNAQKSMMSLVLEHEQMGCEKGQEFKLFSDSDCPAGTTSLHFPSVLASELNGSLQAISLGESQGMQYLLDVPYSESLDESIAA